MNKIRLFVFMSFFFSINLFAQTEVSNIRDELKDSLIARFNRNDFKSIHQLIDTSWHITEQNIENFFSNTRKNHGKILNAEFLTDSVCSDCPNKTANYYALELQLRTFLLLLDVSASKKITSLGLSNYTFPERTETSTIKTSNPFSDSFDLSVDSVVRAYFRNPYATALSIGIIRNGQEFFYHYGETTKGNNQLPTNETLYELGSITKTFTSTILANAVLENRVSLNDDIRKYLPEAYPNLEYNGKAITLQDLSNHTSRIPSLPDDYFTHPKFDPLKPWNDYTITMFWQSLHRVVIDTLPGCKSQYSNVAVMLLGHILENVYRLSFDKLIKQYVTEPFGMKHTSAIFNEKNKKKLASKYSSNGNPVSYWVQPASTPAGTGMLTNLEDMLNYLNHQIEENNPAVKLTHQPTFKNSGLGWGVRNSGTKNRVHEHNGGTTGFTTNIMVFPEIKSGFVILANSDTELAKLIRRLYSLIVQ